MAEKRVLAHPCRHGAGRGGNAYGSLAAGPVMRDRGGNVHIDEDADDWERGPPAGAAGGWGSGYRRRVHQDSPPNRSKRRDRR